MQQSDEGGSQHPASRAVTIMGGSSVAAAGASGQGADRGYFRSQSLDLPRLEPGGAVARRLALLRRAPLLPAHVHPVGCLVFWHLGTVSQAQLCRCVACTPNRLMPVARKELQDVMQDLAGCGLAAAPVHAVTAGGCWLGRAAHCLGTARSSCFLVACLSRPEFLEAALTPLCMSLRRSLRGQGGDQPPDEAGYTRLAREDPTLSNDPTLH